MQTGLVPSESVFTLNPDIANVFCCHWEQSSSFSAVEQNITDIKIG
jgi:hypothetical protein